MIGLKHRIEVNLFKFFGTQVSKEHNRMNGEEDKETRRLGIKYKTGK